VKIKKLWKTQNSTGILRTNRFKENTPLEVKDLNDEPIYAGVTVKETYVADFDSFKPFGRES
jgi:hypothetical protein